MELEPNLLDWNVNELERKLELEDMKRTPGGIFIGKWNEFGSQFPLCLSSIRRKKYDIVFVAMYLMWMHCHFSYIINKTEDSSVQQCAVHSTAH